MSRTAKSRRRKKEEPPSPAKAVSKPPDLSIPSFAPVRSAPSCVSAPPTRLSHAEEEEQKSPSEEDEESEDDDSEGDICMDIEEEVIVADDSAVIILPEEPIYAEPIYTTPMYTPSKPFYTTPIYTPAKRKYSEFEGETNQSTSLQKVVKKSKIQADPMHFVAKRPRRNGYRHKNAKNGGEVETPRRIHEMRKFERKEAYRRDDDEYVVDEDYMPGGRRAMKSKSHYRLRGQCFLPNKKYDTRESRLKLKKARHINDEPLKSRRNYNTRSRTKHSERPVRNRRAKKILNPEPPKPRRPRNRRAKKLKQQALMQQESGGSRGPELRRTTRERRKPVKIQEEPSVETEPRRTRERRKRAKLVTTEA